MISIIAQFLCEKKYNASSKQSTNHRLEMLVYCVIDFLIVYISVLHAFRLTPKASQALDITCKTEHRKIQKYIPVT